MGEAVPFHPRVSSPLTRLLRYPISKTDLPAWFSTPKKLEQPESVSGRSKGVEKQSTQGCWAPIQGGTAHLISTTCQTILPISVNGIETTETVRQNLTPTVCLTRTVGVGWHGRLLCFIAAILSANATQ